MLTLFRLNDNATQNTYNYGGEVILQENLVTTVEVLEYDFRKIGYCENPLPNPAKSILSADTSSITFLTDVDFNGVVDTMTYSLGDTTELTSTPNPNDKMLYRTVNGNKTGVNLGITLFKMKYYDVLGNELTPPLKAPTGISSMEIDIRVENTSGYDKQYTYAFWRQIRLASRNLNNR